MANGADNLHDGFDMGYDSNRLHFYIPIMDEFDSKVAPHLVDLVQGISPHAGDLRAVLDHRDSRVGLPQNGANVLPTPHRARAATSAL